MTFTSKTNLTSGHIYIIHSDASGECGWENETSDSVESEGRPQSSLHTEMTNRETDGSPMFPE